MRQYYRIAKLIKLEIIKREFRFQTLKFYFSGISFGKSMKFVFLAATGTLSQ